LRELVNLTRVDGNRLPARRAPQCQDVSSRRCLWEIRLSGLEKLAGGGEASEVEVYEPNSAMTLRKLTLEPSAAAVFRLPCEEQTS
jgi:hypothetical protein